MRAVGVDFNFLSGILRSRESALLSRQKLESILAAGGSAALQAVEGLFGDRAKSIPGAAGIEAGYAAEISSLAELLRYSPSGDFIRLVYLPWDFHNLKAAMLMKLDGRGGEELFGPEGETGIARLREAAENRDFGGLPRHLADAVAAALARHEAGGGDLRGFELVLDRRKQVVLEAFSRGISTQIHDHFRTVSDIAAADAFFRAYFARLPWDSVSAAFEGHPDALRLKALFHGKAEDWGNAASGISRRTVKHMLMSVSTAPDAASAVAREKRSHSAAMSAWSYKPPSAEYAFYFFARKLSDLYNLRLVLLGIIGRVPESDIRNRINDAFI